jgi:hypothetical protein
MTTRIFILFFCALLFSAFFFGCKGKAIVAVKDPKSAPDSTFNKNWKNIPGFHHGNNGFSILLNNGSILWLYGKSNINNAINGMVPCNTNVSNAAVVQSKSGSYTLLNIGNTDYIPTDANGSHYTPSCGFYYEDSIFVYCSKPNVKNVLYIAKLYKPSLVFLKMDSIIIPSSVIYNGEYQFGLSMASDTTKGYSYNYGKIVSGANQGSIIVAQHSLDNPHKPWKYFAANNVWNADINKAIPVIQKAPDNFSIQSLKGQFVLLTKEASTTCGKGLDIFSAIGAEANGPFNGQQKIFTIPDQYKGYSPSSTFVYLHNGLIDGSNYITITYSLNGYNTCTSDCEAGLTNPEHFSCRGFRLPLNSLYNKW